MQSTAQLSRRLEMESGIQGFMPFCEDDMVLASSGQRRRWSCVLSKKDPTAWECLPGGFYGLEGLSVPERVDRRKK